MELKVVFYHLVTIVLVNLLLIVRNFHFSLVSQKTKSAYNQYFI